VLTAGSVGQRAAYEHVTAGNAIEELDMSSLGDTGGKIQDVRVANDLAGALDHSARRWCH